MPAPPCLPRLRLPVWRRVLPLVSLAGVLALAACGGSGSPTASDAPGAAAATPAAATALVTAPSTATVTPPAAAPTGQATAAAAAGSLSAPAWPRTGITAAELAVVIIEGDSLSEAIGREYQRQRGIPEANLVRVHLPAGSDLVSDTDFARARAQFEARVPAHVQATVLAFAQPSRVLGTNCAMSITSAMAFGYDAAWCGGCAHTRASPYFDAETSRPWTDLHLRPSMMLPAYSLAQAQALIARGVQADGSRPRAEAWLVRTSDVARSVRYPDFEALPAAWAASQELAVHFADALHLPLPGVADGRQNLMFYFTGAIQVPGLQSHQWLPGAVADHLTSYAGRLPDANGQMPATQWLDAGATGSYGSVEEPCNYTQKFPQASVLIDHYLRGETLIEAYWKSVAWPGQGLFIGEPLARPYAQESSSGIDAAGALWLQTRNLRRAARYDVQWQADGQPAWQTLAGLQAGQPQAVSWRAPLPARSGQLRWLGPCVADITRQCPLDSAP